MKKTVLKITVRQTTWTRAKGYILDLTIPGGMGGKETAEQLLAIDKEGRVLKGGYQIRCPLMNLC